MPKRNPYKPGEIREKQLQLLLRGTRYVSLDTLVHLLGVTEKTIERTLGKMENVDVAKLRKTPNDQKGQKAYRLYDSEVKNTLFISKDDLRLLYDQIFYKKLEAPLSDQLLKLITISQAIKGEIHQLLQGQFSMELEKYARIIQRAIRTDQKILINGYYARNGQRLDNKVMSPVLLDQWERRLYALEKGKGIYIKLENIENIKLLDQKREKVKNWDPYKDQDVFGFLPNDEFKKKIAVELLLGRFARSQLMTQFPKLADMLTLNKKNSKYSLAIEVYDIQPIARFVTGLFDEIQIVGNEEAKRKIEEYYFQRVVKGYNKNYNRV